MGIPDPTMLPISEVTYEKYHELILGLMEESLRSYVQATWTKAIYDDPNRKGYPIRTTLNDIEAMAREVKRAEQSHTFKGYMLPGCDVVKLAGGASSYQGWRPNMLVIEMDGKKLARPKVVNFTVWGQHVSLWADKDLAPQQRRRVTLPLYRLLSIIAEERDFDTQSGKKKGWTLLFYIGLHEKAPIAPEVLANALLTCENAYTVDQLNESHVYGAVVLKGIKWRHAQGIDEWTDSPDKFESRQVMDSEGKPVMRLNQATNRMEPVYDRVPRRVKSPIGQPFIQDLIGSEEVEGTPPTTWTMKLNLDTGVQDNFRPAIDFVNYKYGKPDLWIVGLDKIIEGAVVRGNLYDPDPEKNPFAVLNNSYRGSDLIAVVNFTKHSPYTAPRTSQKLIYLTFIPGLVMFANPATLPANDVRIPPLEEETGVVSEVTTPAPPAPAAPTPTPEPTPVTEPQLPTGDFEEVADRIMRQTGFSRDDVIAKVEEKKKELDYFVNDIAAIHIVAKDLGVPPTEEVVAPPPEADVASTLEEELMAMDYKALQDRLRPYRDQGYEIVLNQTKLGLINQLIGIETQAVVSAKKVMEVHAEEAKAVEAPQKILSVQERKAKVREAKAKLLAQEQAQIEPTAELKTEDTEFEQRRKELREILQDLIVDFPNSNFASLWGNDNDLEIFPEWVTEHHQPLVDEVIQNLLKEM